mmetsp:Transcript_14481/g.36237  ORF Transcript_14481/g.36237 Transcript_14481/m.36237 type:complete len:217 (-) Transcript_14481:153-803(-)
MMASHKAPLSHHFSYSIPRDLHIFFSTATSLSCKTCIRFLRRIRYFSPCVLGASSSGEITSPLLQQKQILFHRRLSRSSCAAFASAARMSRINSSGESSFDTSTMPALRASSRNCSTESRSKLPRSSRWISVNFRSDMFPFSSISVHFFSSFSSSAFLSFASTAPEDPTIAMACSYDFFASPHLLRHCSAEPRRDHPFHHLASRAVHFFASASALS